MRIWSRPVEVADAIPFEEDELHASYDPDHAQALWRGLLQADRVMKAFQSGFVGKASPVQFFWGSFDLATARYSGRPAPRHPGGAPNCPDWVMVEAYSREEISVGWWPASDEPGPMFYAYAYPEPPGYRTAAIQPAEAAFDPRYGEFLLPYDAVRQAADPDAAALAFFRSDVRGGRRPRRTGTGRCSNRRSRPAGRPTGRGACLTRSRRPGPAIVRTATTPVGVTFAIGDRAWRAHRRAPERQSIRAFVGSPPSPWPSSRLRWSRV